MILLCSILIYLFCILVAAKDRSLAATAYLIIVILVVIILIVVVVF